MDNIMTERKSQVMCSRTLTRTCTRSTLLEAFHLLCNDHWGRPGNHQPPMLRREAGKYLQHTSFGHCLCSSSQVGMSKSICGRAAPPCSADK
jgi:hypothetical protein